MSRVAAVVVALLSTLAACSAPKRANPLPQELADRAEILGVPLVRMWADAPPEYYEKWLAHAEEHSPREVSAVRGREHNYLSISGGGPRGAFGAGLLCGWTEEGSRPEFTLVAGISTGALIAPFAFLGPDYDDELEEIYTTFSTEDLIEKKSLLSILRSDSAVGTAPMREKLELYYDEALLDAIEAETRKGRALVIGTTNLDAMRPVIWNIGRIAKSDSPNRVKLFQDVIMASAAIPGAFPPVYFDVEVDGITYDEMHVDGGATSQLFLYPIGLDWERVLEDLEVPGSPDVYTIRNSKLSADYQVVNRGVIAISAHTIGSLMRISGYGDMYRVYLAAIRDGLDYHLAYIPDDFDVPPGEGFDTTYMKALFERGREMAKGGYPWDKAPPGVVTDAGE